MVGHNEHTARLQGLEYCRVQRVVVQRSLALHSHEQIVATNRARARRKKHSLGRKQFFFEKKNQKTFAFSLAF
jgi:hypothetical protein